MKEADSRKERREIEISAILFSVRFNLSGGFS